MRTHLTPIRLLFAIFACLSMIVSANAQTKEECLACHSDSSLSMERKGKQVSLFVDAGALNNSMHRKLVCVACHAGFDAQNVPHKEKIEPVKCLTCHKDAPLKHQFHPQMNVAGGGAVTCKDCHGTHDVHSPKSPDSKFHSAKLTEFCGSCHGDVKSTFVNSSHAHAQVAGIQGAPSCIDCHRNPIVHTSATQDSTQLKIVQQKLCLSCHLDDPNVRARISPTAGFIAAYESSVHGSALARGNSKAANCVDCHGSHEMKKGSDPTSRVAKANIPQTCARCHAEIAKAFESSVHGQAVRNGVTSAPVCTDCHGEHNILKHTDPRSPVAAANVSSQVCSPCHSSVKLSQKYGLANDRFKSFSDSYHGLATSAGSVQVANCASCHGVHDIKPSSDPTSSINKTNLIKTCGRCHPGANENFTRGAVHVIATEKSDSALYYVSTMYIILILVVVGGMFFHNLIDFIRKSRRQLMYRRGLIPRPPVAHRLYLRMTFSERIQHVTLLTSFITLVLTGFALKYPDAWWVVPLRNISPVMFELRGIFHRIAAVVMVGASLYHLYYIFFVPRGKELIRDLLPSLDDFMDAIAVLKYNIGLSNVKPKFGRFSYIEKSEYWALIWGTIVMAATGTILWFDNTFLGLLTKTWWDVAREVHYYEAWLATLSIIVWHFYFVIFNPDVYPINLAFWKGTLTEEEMEDEHPKELEAIHHAEMKAELEKEAERERAEAARAEAKK
ncbi:MAG TPA: cytochrome b/b6 domain-containing protein [Bacteroidota bacterium]|nr:cytochrome b/b6 domain-containing protein [Bacteroidota bacterium]